jgi:hypothetical protein
MNEQNIITTWVYDSNGKGYYKHTFENGGVVYDSNSGHYLKSKPSKGAPTYSNTGAGQVVKQIDPLTGKANFVSYNRANPTTVTLP